MFAKLPPWLGNLVTGLVIVVLAVGVRQILFMMFPDPVSPAAVTSPTMTPEEAAASPFTVAQAALGNRVADHYALVDQEGNPFDPAGWYDKPMVVAFIFTNCEDVCPAINSNLRKTFRLHGWDILGEEFRILMVGFDTARDTPAAMKKFGAEFTDDFTDWKFVTGDPAEVKRFADDLGATFKPGPNGPGGPWLHTVGVTVVAGHRVYAQIFGPAPSTDEVMRPVMEAQGKTYEPLPLIGGEGKNDAAVGEAPARPID
jgi:protein SCO1/2